MFHPWSGGTPEGVAKALRNPEARQEATKAYGIQWLTDSKETELRPADALKDNQFMAQYYQLKLSASRKRGAQPSTANAGVNLAHSCGH